MFKIGSLLTCIIAVIFISAYPKDEALPREREGQVLGKEIVNKELFNYKMENDENIYELKPPKVFEVFDKDKLESLLSIYTHNDGQIYRIKWILPCPSDQRMNLKSQLKVYSKFKTEDYDIGSFGYLEYFDEKTKFTVIFNKNRVTFTIYDLDAIKKGKPDW